MNKRWTYPAFERSWARQKENDEHNDRRADLPPVLLREREECVESFLGAILGRMPPKILIEGRDNPIRATEEKENKSCHSNHGCDQEVDSDCR
ncbi:hypothetical protein K2X96_01210 [Patescibacteria group bacterium]|nr:hypothetical protein [Patescibacteria group bacterium]